MINGHVVQCTDLVIEDPYPSHVRLEGDPYLVRLGGESVECLCLIVNQVSIWVRKVEVGFEGRDLGDVEA